MEIYLHKATIVVSGSDILSLGEVQHTTSSARNMLLCDIMKHLVILCTFKDLCIGTPFLKIHMEIIGQ